MASIKSLLKRLKTAFKEWVKRNIVDDNPYEEESEFPGGIHPDPPKVEPYDSLKPVDEQKPTSGDDVPFGDLKWEYGGFKGEKAEMVDGCRIGNLKVGSNLTYKWVEGGCERLGATSRTDADHTMACLFCLLDGRWVGGKFDWISTSRTSRSFKNIETGYRGWPKDAISRAREYAFCIVGSDKSIRSNVILFKR